MADNPVWDEEKRELRVMERKCSTCIFGPSTILEPSSFRKLVKEAQSNGDGGSVVCHKTIKAFAGDVPGAMCYGYWHRFFRNTFLGRLARSWDLIHWWPEPKNETLVERLVAICEQDES